MLIDTHTHCIPEYLNDDAEGAVSRALGEDIWLVNIGTDLKSSKQCVEVAEKYDEGVYASIGIHPDEVSTDFDNTNLTDLDELAPSSPKIVAVGECGLDYYRLEGDGIAEKKKKQYDAFIKQISLAKKYNLALIIHGRGEKENLTGVYDEIIEILKTHKLERVVCHCFGGSLEQAQKLAELGCYIGVTGIVTFKNARDLQNIVKVIPLENIVIETDAPYLAPEPNRGKPNEPSYVKFVAQKIAELRGVSFEQVAQVTTVNARRLFII